MQVFTQFSSDLDETTQNQLANGRALMEVLKQPQAHPLTMADQVITLIAGTGRVMMDVPVKSVKKFQSDLLNDMHVHHADVMENLEKTGTMDDALQNRILQYAKDFHDEWMKQVS